MPVPDDDPALHGLVNQYQTHKHSKSCKKYRNKLCRYGFCKFFTEETINAQSLEDSIKDVKRYSISRKRDTILSKVSDFINKYLAPSKDIYRKDSSIMVFCWNCNWQKRNIIGHFLYQVIKHLSCI